MANVQHPAIRFDVPQGFAEPTVLTADGFLKMRMWQARCFDALANSHHWIMNAPMAAGKSFLISALVGHALAKTPELKAIIAVPQTNIAAGFRQNKILLNDHSRLDWSIDVDLCRESATQSVRHLLTFLRESRQRTLVCTHATLVRAFQQAPELFREVLAVIDEAHHIKHGDEIENQLGSFVRYALDHSSDIRLGLATATFYRGDAAPIVPDLNRFDRFELPFDEFLASCEHLRSFSYDFIVEPDYLSAVSRLFDKRIGKTIVYIPPVGSMYSVGNKRGDVEAIIKAIAGTEKPEVKHEGPVMQVRRGDDWLRVVDLVNEDSREGKKNYIEAAHQGAEDLDVIIALGIFKEGGNWRYADREIIIGPRYSLTETVQTVGRLFRDQEGKVHVEVFHVLPFTFDFADPQTARANLNDYLKGIMLSLLIENVIQPAYVEPKEDAGEVGPRAPRTNYLREAVRDEGQALAIMAEITERVIGALATFSPDQVEEHFDVIVSEVLTSYGVSEYHEEITRQMLRMFTRRSALLIGLNVGHVDIDLVKQSPFDFALRYTTEHCGAKTFQELRKALRAYGVWVPFEQAREIARAQGFATYEEYQLWTTRPVDVPASPSTIYPEQWINWADWLGNGKRVGDWLPYEQALEIVRVNGFKSVAEFHAWDERPGDIPSNPQKVYEEWRDWSDWLGCATTRRGLNKDWLPFEEARAIVRAQNFSNAREFYEWRKEQNNIPKAPETVYGESWIDWSDWLGSGFNKYGSREWLCFDEARQLVRSNGLTSKNHYHAWKERPINLPSNPDKTYKNEWKGWQDWLGKS